MAQASSTYSFSSAPKAVSGTRRPKYREPGEADTTIYRDPKETSITWNKCVHRGNTYSVYTQRAIKEALDQAQQPHEPAPRRRRKPKEESIFRMGLPEPARVIVDLSQNLVAAEVRVEVEQCEAQTDEFLPEPPPEQFQPQKTGVSASTQVEDGELFNFDWEVEPILDVLVNKTLEQSVMEVEEEWELAQMQDFKSEWHDRQTAMMKDWEVQVAAEWVRWDEKEKVVARKREEKRREAQVLLKIQAMAVARAHLTGLVPNAVGAVKEVAFPDEREAAISRVFMPQLLGQVRSQLAERRKAEEVTNSIVEGAVTAHQTVLAGSTETHTQMRRDLGRRRYEEAQIRQGIIRIYVPDDQGGKKAVGPITITSQETVEEIQDKIAAWMTANDRQLAASFPHGVLLCVGGQAVDSSASLFETQLGQINLQAMPEPDAPEQDPSADAGDEDEDGAGQENES